MHFSIRRTAFTIIALGCLLPVFALTEIVRTDGSVVRGTIVSEDADVIVLDVDGINLTVARSTIQEIRSDDGQSAPSASSDETTGYSGESTSSTSAYTATDVQREAPPPTQPASATQSAPVSGNVDITTQGRPRIGRESRERVTIGADVYWSLDAQAFTDNNTENETHSRRTTLVLKPYVGIRLSDILEVRPSLQLTRTARSSEQEVQQGATSVSLSDDTSSTGLGLDFGLFFYPVRGGFFRFVIGPAVGFNITFPPKSERSTSTTTIDLEFDRYVNITIPIHVPFSFDFVVSEHLGFRLSSDVLSFNLNINSVEEDEPSTLDYTDVDFSAMLDLTKTITQLGIGVFLLF
ncbi:MAG: hypothetical protein JW913_07080 [Chitinispirillaceae bacterium]|nr:hypothetical protein [Chitinispirillaceae bacterium]